MRVRFEEQLKQLNVELIKMGALCEEAISGAADAMLHGNSEQIKKSMAADREIDQKERDIEALCMKLLLQQQPVAKDLRVISSALKMISDMERIGDQASDICEIAKHTSGIGELRHKKIEDLASATIKMVTESINSFVEKDLKKAHFVMAYDDTVDALFCEVKEELIKAIEDKSGGAELCLDILMVAKYFERIGDHAVNIAEWVEYSINGKTKDEIQFEDFNDEADEQ